MHNRCISWVVLTYQISKSMSVTWLADLHKTCMCNDGYWIIGDGPGTEPLLVSFSRRKQGIPSIRVWVFYRCYHWSLPEWSYLIENEGKRILSSKNDPTRIKGIMLHTAFQLTACILLPIQAQPFQSAQLTVPWLWRTFNNKIKTPNKDLFLPEFKRRRTKTFNGSSTKHHKRVSEGSVLST